jgi:putative oxidoreductase
VNPGFNKVVGQGLLLGVGSDPIVCMQTLLRIVRLEFIPRMPDVALLLLRIWLGLTMLLVHGLEKLMTFESKAEQFADPLGVGSTVSLGLAVFGEVVCSVLLILGLLSRLAAFGLAVTMAIAFFLVHNASLEMGPGSGELAFIYLAGFITLILAGPGRWALDTMVFARSGGGRV